MIITTIIVTAVPTFITGVLAGGYIWNKLIWWGMDRHVTPCTKHDSEAIEFGSREEAEQVLDDLLDTLHSYGQATVADYKDFSGVASNIITFTDYKYGWIDLRGARVMTHRGRYAIDLPKTVLLGESE